MSRLIIPGFIALLTSDRTAVFFMLSAAGWWENGRQKVLAWVDLGGRGEWGIVCRFYCWLRIGELGEWRLPSETPSEHCDRAFDDDGCVHRA